MVYLVFMILACISAWGVSQYTPTMPVNDRSQRWFIAVTAFVGAFLFAKLPFWVFGPDQLLHAGAFLFSGKTVLMGLVGGYLSVELAKCYLQIRVSTGDSFVVPVAVGIAVGRLGCFFGGCCFGTPTELPWGVVFPAMDQATRHPTQLYESLFHLLAAIVIFVLLKLKWFNGQLIKLYFLSYFVFRFVTEFIRPEIKLVAGLSVYQLAILLLCPIFVWLWIRDVSRTRAQK